MSEPIADLQKKSIIIKYYCQKKRHSTLMLSLLGATFVDGMSVCIWIQTV